MITQEVPLQEIDTVNFPFSFRGSSDLALLSDSLMKIGLINPPVLFRTDGSDQFTVARGAGRIQAAAQVGMKSISARISADTDPLLHLTAGIHENACERPLTVSEKARALELLIKFGVAGDEAVKDYFPVMGIPGSPFWFDFLTRVSTLSPEMQEALDAGHLSQQAVLFLSQQPRDEANLLFMTMQRLRFTLNQQRIAVGLLEDLMGTKGRAMKSILDHPDIEPLVSIAGRRSSATGDRFISALSGIRNPGLTEMEHTFETTVRKMALPTAVTVTHHPNFEQKRVTLRMIWRSSKEARFILGKLNEAEQSGLIDTLMETS